MKKIFDARLGIIFISLVLILSIFALMILNGSTAWFAENKDVGAQGFTVTVDSDIQVSATLQSFPITAINGDIYTISRETESYMLPEHDPNSISYSEYKKALAVIITVDAHSDSVISMDLISGALSDTVITPALSNYISNCMKITPASLNADGTVATKGAPLATPTFVDLSTNPVSKDDSIELMQGVSVHEGEVNEFCFIIEYDETLLDYIGQKILEQHLNDNKVSYADDIEFRIHE